LTGHHPGNLCPYIVARRGEEEYGMNVLENRVLKREFNEE
jgi:hypothetical protein